jgi:hypothetical protein
MRSSCKESLRLRATRLFCISRKPEICRVMYQEYATTAAKVMTRPRNSPSVGEGRDARRRSTLRGYNDSRFGSRMTSSKGKSVLLNAQSKRCKSVNITLITGPFLGDSQTGAGGLMLSKCANPACVASFRYLHEGKVFRLEKYMLAGNLDASSRSFEYFWLCASCANSFTVVVEEQSVRVKPLHLKLPPSSLPLATVETRRVA